MDLSEIKQNRALLLHILGREKPGRHLKCPWHEETHGSFSVWRGTDGVWLWKCHAGCGSGTVIDAAMLAYGVRTPAEAMRAIESRLGVKVGRDEDYQTPRIDTARAETFIRHAHERLMSDFEVQEKYLAGKRGITDLRVVEKYRLGWAEKVAFRGWRSWRFTGWVIPVTDAGGRLLGCKLHCEGRRERDMPKCMWAPFGTYPEKKPKNGTATLWPAPEEWKGIDSLYLLPGELKALALVSVGFAATSVTSGEGQRFPQRFLDRLVRVGPGQVFVVYDDDEPGYGWRDAAQKGLEKAGLFGGSFSYGEARSAEPPCSPNGEHPPESELNDIDAEWARATGQVPPEPEPACNPVSEMHDFTEGQLLEIESETVGTFYVASNQKAMARAPEGAVVYLLDEVAKLSGVDEKAAIAAHRLKERFGGTVEGEKR